MGRRGVFIIGRYWNTDEYGRTGYEDEGCHLAGDPETPRTFKWTDPETGEIYESWVKQRQSPQKT